MASRRELDALRKRLDKAEDDRDFAARHGYDAAYAKKGAEVKDLTKQYRALKES